MEFFPYNRNSVPNICTNWNGTLVLIYYSLIASSYSLS